MLSEVAVNEGAVGGAAPARSSSSFRIPHFAFRILEVASGKGALALMDQAVVSGTSFLTTILVGRWCGAGELGAYSLGFSLLVAWAGVQESLIAVPYTLYWHRCPPEEQRGYSGSVLAHQAMLSALALVALT